MSDDDSDKIPMAECGSCRAVIPLNSKDCPECGIQFSGVSDDSLGECGACKALVPLDSKSCPKCGVYFVADDVVDVLRKWFTETGIEVKSLFNKMDVDGDGSIDSQELKDGLLKLNLADLPPSQIDRLVAEFDSDDDGKISLQELVFTITGKEMVSGDDSSDADTEDTASGQKEFSESVLVRMMDKFSITERDAFLLHAQDYDSNDNGYLTEGELKAAAEAFEGNSQKEVTTESKEEYDEVVESEDTGIIVEETSDEETEELVEESSDEEVVEDSEELETTQEHSAMYKLGLAASERGMSIREVFESMDSDDDGMVDGPELQKGIEGLSGEQLSPAEVHEILKTLDADTDGRVNPLELVKALEELDIDLVSDKPAVRRDPVAILIDAMDEAGSNPGRVFKDLDKNGDGNINIKELRAEVENFIGNNLTDEEIDDLFDRLDDDGDGSIDMYEFIENLEEYEEEEDKETSLSNKVEFPSKMQARMMSKKWNDIFWPLIHAGLFIFVVMWIVNGSLAPFVSGEEGSIALDTESGIYNDDGMTYLQDDIYPCVDSVQTDGCRNSLTPFAGEDGSTSMPAGFYWDGIMFIVLGSIGFIGSLLTQFYIVPGWRARARAIKDSQKDRKEVDEEKDEDSNEEHEEEELEEETEHIADESEEVVDDVEEEPEDESGDDNEDADDDEIDVGSHIGIVLDDEEVYGVIVEFDDDEGLVTIEEDGTGDLVTGYQDDMFLED